MGNAKKAVFHLVGDISPALESSDEKKILFQNLSSDFKFFRWFRIVYEKVIFASA